MNTPTQALSIRQPWASLEMEGLATPHVLRHCWATHVVDAGGDICDVKDHLGHKSLETTMVYVHRHTDRLRSPLEAEAQRQVIEVLPANVVPFARHDDRGRKHA